MLSYFPPPATISFSLFLVSPMEFLASDPMMVLQRANSLFSYVFIVWCASRREDRLTSNTVVPEFPLALEELC